MIYAKNSPEIGEALRAIQVLNKQRHYKIHGPSVASYCVQVLRSFSDDVRALSIVFVGPGQMRTINRKYLRHDYATDVLSFSYNRIMVEGRPFLGEIIIAPEIAAEHAARFRTSPEKELRKLLVHGILHLLDYDHETDMGQMTRLQRKLLRRKSLAKPLAMKETP